MNKYAKLSRRQFLELTALASAGTAAALIGLPRIAFAQEATATPLPELPPAPEAAPAPVPPPQ